VMENALASGVEPVGSSMATHQAPQN